MLKKCLSLLLAALALTFVPTALAAGDFSVPQALSDTVRSLSGDEMDLFLPYDIDGDGTAELACLYVETIPHDGWSVQYIHCDVYQVDGTGRAVQVYTNGEGDALAGAPGFYLVEVDYEGVRRLAYKYTNFDSVSVTDYTVFTPIAGGGVRAHVMHAGIDVADQVLPPEYTLDGAPIGQGEFDALEASAAVRGALGGNTPADYDPALTAQEFLAAYDGGPAEQQLDEMGEVSAPGDLVSMGTKLVKLTEDMEYTDKGIDVDQMDLIPWMREHIDYFYDDAGNLVRELSTRQGLLSSGVSPYQEIVYEYDGAGHLIGETTDQETAVFTVDENGRTSLEQWYGTDGSFHRWIRHSYDSAGNETETIQGYGAIDDLSDVMYYRYTLNGDGRPLSVDVHRTVQLDPVTHAIVRDNASEYDTSSDWRDDYYYDDTGTLYHSTTVWGGLTAEREYDQYENLSSLDTYNQGQLILAERYENTYDDKGTLLEVVRRLSSGEVLQTYTYTYGEVGGGPAPAEEEPAAPPPADAAPAPGGQLTEEENYDLLRTYWINNIGQDCAGEMADVDRDGLADFIYVDWFSDDGILRSYVLTVKNGAVKSILLDEGTDAHVSGYFNLFVKVDDATGTADLIDYTDAMYQGYGSCSFSVFHLDREGNRVETGGLTVASAGGSPITDAQLEDFDRRAVQLLENTVCLHDSGLDDILMNVTMILYPQVSTNYIFDMGIEYE